MKNIITILGAALFPVGMSKSSARKIINFLLIMFNQTFKDKALRSKPIVITATGIKKTISQPHRNPEMKIKILKNILEEIKNAEYAKSAISYKQWHEGQKVIYHYLEVKFEGQVSYINVLEDSKKGELTFYSITDMLQNNNPKK